MSVVGRRANGSTFIQSNIQGMATSQPAAGGAAGTGWLEPARGSDDAPSQTSRIYECATSPMTEILFRGLANEMKNEGDATVLHDYQH